MGTGASAGGSIGVVCVVGAGGDEERPVGVFGLLG